MRIIGSVQGVFFRARAKQVADELGIKGWIRNAEDGSVEIHAEGTEDALKKFEQWCHRGPPGAKVERVEVQEVPEEGCEGFEVRT
ncbi:acylphosphatase [Candidatus Peregrinibacteria bacterium]|nr:acylphosphatase [Candidatus Peregrinibacteria bacterium]MBI3816819.1 acylphosphatase [Candidatus Peregrinibacteria bacterium]